MKLKIENVTKCKQKAVKISFMCGCKYVYVYVYGCAPIYPTPPLG